MTDDLARALAFMRGVNERRASRVEPLSWGAALFADGLPSIWDGNLVIADRWDGTPAALRDEVDRVQGGAGLAHRKLVVYDQELGARLAGELGETDWPLRNRYAVMALRRQPDRAPEPGLAGEIDLGAFEQAKREALRDQPYGSDETVVVGLLELDRRTAASTDVRRFGTVVDGEPASYCELRSDGRTAQIEDVATVPRFRNRGLARATVLAAADAARAAGHELVFLVADRNDWPLRLYLRLGFDEIGTEYGFIRPGS